MARPQLLKEGEGSPDAIMSYERAGDAHMGPIPLRGNTGTVTSEQRNAIWHSTGVSVSVRWRQQWGARCLSLSGPAEKLSEAKRMADEAIRANGSEGGRAQQPGDGAELSRQVSQVAGSQNTMWASMQAMTGRIAVLETQMLEAQQAAAAAYAAAAAAQNAAHQMMLQRKKRRKKDPPRKSSSEEDKKETANPASASGIRSMAKNTKDSKDSKETPQPEQMEKTDEKTEENNEEKHEEVEPPREKIKAMAEPMKIDVKKEVSDEEKPCKACEPMADAQQPCSPTSDANKTDASESEADSPHTSTATLQVDLDGNPLVPVEAAEGLPLTELETEEAKPKLDD